MFMQLQKKQICKWIINGFAYTRNDYKALQMTSSRIIYLDKLLKIIDRKQKFYSFLEKEKKKSQIESIYIYFPGGYKSKLPREPFCF